MKTSFLINKVIVRPDIDNTMSDGVLVANYNERHFSYAVTGIVEKAPDKLVCDYEGYQKARKSHSQRIQSEKLKITRRGLLFMPERIEIKEGDRVMYRYNARVRHEEAENKTPQFIINYSDIFCVLDKQNSPTPINGYILASPLSEEEKSAFKVIFKSAYPNKGYIQDRPYTETEVQIGENILIQKGRFRVLNHPFYPIINHPDMLVAFHRANVLGKFS